MCKTTKTIKTIKVIVEDAGGNYDAIHTAMVNLSNRTFAPTLRIHYLLMLERYCDQREWSGEISTEEAGKFRVKLAQLLEKSWMGCTSYVENT